MMYDAAVGGSHTYEMRGYRPLMYVVMGANILVFGTLAVSAAAFGSIGVAGAVLVAYAVLLVVGLRAQQRTAVRLTVSTAGLDVAWIFGTHFTPWQGVRRIRFLRSRRGPRNVQQIEVQVVGDRPLQFFSRLSEFDKLTAHLRATQTQLIEE